MKLDIVVEKQATQTMRKSVAGNVIQQKLWKWILMKKIKRRRFIKICFSIHDPTTLDAQGVDIGRQYCSEIFYSDEEQKKVAEKIRDEINKKHNGKVVTKISKVLNYKKAEDFHQKYEKILNMNLVTTEWLEKNLSKVKFLMLHGTCHQPKEMQLKNMKINIFQCNVLGCR